MTYILLIIFLHGYGNRATTVTIDFSSKKNCLDAAAEVSGAYKRSHSDSLLTNVCLPK